MDSWSLPIKAVHFIKAGKYSKGIAMLKSAIKKDPEDAWSFWHLGEAYLIKGEIKKAIVIWNEWRNLIKKVDNWPHSWIYYCYALTCLLLKKDPEKNKNIKTAILMMKNYKNKDKFLKTDKLLNLGLYSILDNQLDQGYFFYKKALNKNPDQILLKESIWNLNILNACYINRSDDIKKIIELINKEITQLK